jgi:hypothetical protein
VRNEQPGTTFHRSRRHRNRDDGKPGYPLLFSDSAELLVSSLKDEREVFLESFPADDEGKASAWRLGHKLAAMIRLHQKVGTMSILVEMRPGVGWGVWVSLEPGEPREASMG